MAKPNITIIYPIASFNREKSNSIISRIKPIQEYNSHTNLTLKLGPFAKNFYSITRTQIQTTGYIFKHVKIYRPGIYFKAEPTVTV